MKKILCLVSAAFLILSSCSSDSDSSKESSILVKKTVYTTGEYVLTSKFAYDGNKLKSVKGSDGELFKYTYEGNVITKREYFNNQGKLENTIEFTYTSGKLSSVLKKEMSDDKFIYKTKYKHNTDGTINYEEFKITVATGVEEENGDMGKYTYANGNLVKIESSFYSGGVVSILEYDGNNNPFKNITGYNLLINDPSLSSINNLVKKTNTSNSGHQSLSTLTFKYDSNNYPTERIHSHTSETYDYTQTMQFTY